MTYFMVEVKRRGAFVAGGAAHNDWPIAPAPRVGMPRHLPLGITPAMRSKGVINHSVRRCDGLPKAPVHNVFKHCPVCDCD